MARINHDPFLQKYKDTTPSKPSSGMLLALGALSSSGVSKIACT
mgnify:CR=1 FL=1